MVYSGDVRFVRDFCANISFLKSVDLRHGSGQNGICDPGPDEPVVLSQTVSDSVVVDQNISCYSVVDDPVFLPVNTLLKAHVEPVAEFRYTDQ